MLQELVVTMMRGDGLRGLVLAAEATFLNGMCMRTDILLDIVTICIALALTCPAARHDGAA
jgi:hypothetical protein